MCVLIIVLLQYTFDLSLRIVVSSACVCVCVLGIIANKLDKVSFQTTVCSLSYPSTLFHMKIWVKSLVWKATRTLNCM